MGAEFNMTWMGSLVVSRVLDMFPCDAYNLLILYKRIGNISMCVIFDAAAFFFFLNGYI